MLRNSNARLAAALFILGTGAVLRPQYVTEAPQVMPYVLLAGLLAICVATALWAWATNQPAPAAKEKYNPRGDSHIDIG